MEIQKFDFPELPPDGGILRVLRAGICGADVPMYADDSKCPRILGHENVGIIEALGSIAGERWGVKVGDYVALEEYLPCGHCEVCRNGEYRACEMTNHKGPDGLRYGSTKTSIWPGLWGGYSQFTYIHPRAVMHKVPEGVPPRMAAMALPLGNGFQWTYFDGKAGLGQTVVVQGPGQQGLACVIAARASGAKTVIATGLSQDADRLAVAKRLGADHTIMVDKESLKDRVMKITEGRGADLVLDVSSGGATEVINGGLSILKIRYGTLVVAAFKRKPIDGFDIDMVISKAVTLRGVRGHSFQAVEMGLELMKNPGNIDLEAMSTHEFGLDEADTAVRTVAGEMRVGKSQAIHVTIDPWK
jgi:threonine dehydrogenase-like Zn-dependent dehydrogenase